MNKNQRIGVALLAGALSSACGGAAPLRPGARYYAATVVSQGDLKAEHFAALEQQLPGLLHGREVVLEDARGLQRPLAPNEMDAAVRQALYIVLTTGDAAAQEFDLRVRLANDGRVPVTVWRGPKDGFIVRVGTPTRETLTGPGTPRAGVDLQARFGIGQLVSQGAPWSPRAREVLARTLEVLNGAERRVVFNLPFVREPRGEDPSHGALYRQTNCEAEILLYDEALRSDTEQFVGEPEAPLPTSVRTLLHEIGHAIHQRPARVALCALERSERDLNDRIRTTNARAEHFNRTQGELSVRERDRELAALPAEQANISADRLSFERDSRAADALMAEGPVLVSYRRALGQASPPTLYAETSDRESFAESFSFYRADPAALKRLLPDVFSYFERGEHLRLE